MRAAALAALSVVVFLTSAVALVVVLYLAGGTSSCGENCYRDLYFGPEVLIVVVIVSLGVTALILRYAVRRNRQTNKRPHTPG